MSTSKIRCCDCCGKEIPFDSKRIHMEYDGYVANCVEYIAENAGNPDFCCHSLHDKIYGLVELNMRRDQKIKTVVPSDHFDGARCKDICTECKIKFLEKTIDTLKKFR